MTAAGPTSTDGLTGAQLSVHTTLGIPEAASITDPKHVLLAKKEYVVSFDSERKNPRWTSWELTKSWIGTASRSPAFQIDRSLPAGFGQASDIDYTRSGYERGHLCPSKDRTDSKADNESTFVFTNAVPQTGQSNTDTWESLEEEERALADAGSHLFIIAGSRWEHVKTIGKGVSVPTSMFKVIVVMSGAHPTPADVTSSTRVIAVDIPNTTTVAGSYKKYLTSFGKLESETGLKFLSDVPESVHEALAKVVDADATN